MNQITRVYLVRVYSKDFPESAELSFGVTASEAHSIAHREVLDKGGEIVTQHQAEFYSYMESSEGFIGSVEPIDRGI